MKKEDVISAGVMTIVSILVLVGFTVAWFSNSGVVTTGIHLKAAEKYDIFVALEEGGDDISTLVGDAKNVDMGLQDMTNVEQDKLAPGQFGQITFWVRPTDPGIEYCEVSPQLWISQSAVDAEEILWYPGEVDEASLEAQDELAMLGLYEIVNRHVQFFEDEAMIEPLEDVIRVDWTEEDGMKEIPITIYWKWHYEYPFTEFTEEEYAALTEEKKKEYIDQYDLEDTQIGNNVTAMKFHFTFSAQ